MNKDEEQEEEEDGDSQIMHMKKEVGELRDVSCHSVFEGPETEEHRDDHDE